MKTVAIYLASQSPRRAELLGQIGVDFEVVIVDVPELRGREERAVEFVTRLALEKARAGWLASDGSRPVLGSDTVVVLDDMIMGKPDSDADAEAMLEQLSGRSHEVMTAVALVEGEREAVRLNTTTVSFRDTTAAERSAYVATGEPHDKAGGYGIQGHAAVFIKEIDGSYSGVMGLPLFETGQLLAEFGHPVI